MAKSKKIEKKVKLFNGKPVKPARYQGQDGTYMAVKYEDPKEMENPGLGLALDHAGTPIKWKSLE